MFVQFSQLNQPQRNQKRDSLAFERNENVEAPYTPHWWMEGAQRFFSAVTTGTLGQKP